MKKLFVLLLLPAVFLAVQPPKAQESAEAPGDYFRSPAFAKPMRSIELQYFRVPRDKWDLMIGRMAQYHADTISTYVHWGFHEYEEGKFDFTGQTLPERDLAGFIKLCAKHHMMVVLKPGPFIDAETLAGGIPQWLFERHPETIALTSRGRPFIHGDSGMPRISYLHPQHLAFVERYFKALGKATAPMQFPGGPIIAVQVDNETPGDGFTTISNYLSYNFKADYNEHQVNVLWPEWLAGRYGGIGKLNEAYGSSYTSFSEVPMLREWTDPQDAKAFQIYLDLDRFAEYQYVEALRRFRAMLMEAGFSVPMYQDLLCMPWDLAGMIGDSGGMAQASGGWIGNNIYAEIYRPWTIFTGGVGYAYNFDEYAHMAFWRMRLTRSLSEPYPPFVPEISCARRFYFQAPVAGGADAVNIYVGWQTAVDNPLTSPKGSWGMEACVTADGEVRDCLWNGKNTFMFMEGSGGFLPGAEPPEVAIGYSHEPEHAWNWEFRFNFNRPHKKGRHSALADLTTGANTGDRGQLIAREFIRRDYDFDVIHLDHLKPGQLERYKLVIVPTSPLNPAPGAGGLVEREGGYTLYLPPRFIDKIDFPALEKLGLNLRRAWAEPEDVDVTQRLYPGGPTVLSIVNRGKKDFSGEVFFQDGAEKLSATVGGVAIGFVSVENQGIRAAVIDSGDGGGEYRYYSDAVSFSGKYLGLVTGPGHLAASSPGNGEVRVKIKSLAPPVRLARVLLDGQVMDAPFSFEGGALVFTYEAGGGANRTDMYVALSEGVSLADTVGTYLERTNPRE